MSSSESNHNLLLVGKQTLGFSNWGVIMPSDIGHLILDLLFEVVDRIRFSAVCKNWNIISKEYYQQHVTKPTVFPMLLIPSPDDDVWNPRLYTLSCFGKDFLDLRLPCSLYGKIYYGTSHGWIAVQNKDFTVTLIFPFAREVFTVNLPALRLSVIKLVLSPESTPDDFTVVVIIGEHCAGLATIKSGETLWTYIDPTLASGFIDIVVHQGVIYAIDQLHRVKKVDIHVYPPMIKTVCRVVDSKSRFKLFLVSISSDLYILQKLVLLPDNINSRSRELLFAFILKVHNDEGELIQIRDPKSLGGNLFFLGNNTVIAVNANGRLPLSTYSTSEERKKDIMKISYIEIENADCTCEEKASSPLWIVPRQHCFYQR